MTEHNQDSSKSGEWKNDTHQKLAKKAPMPAALRQRLAGSVYASEGAFRASSAPPVDLLRDQAALATKNDNAPQTEDPSEVSPEDPRLDPNYAAYYLAHSRMDPRLPPPLYTPGQSWQLWANRSNAVGNQATPMNAVWEKPISPPKGASVPSGDETPRRSNLVDMIQEDFPRTPSPVYVMQMRAQRQRELEELKRTAASPSQAAILNDFPARPVIQSESPPKDRPSEESIAQALQTLQLGLDADDRALLRNLRLGGMSPNQTSQNSSAVESSIAALNQPISFMGLRSASTVPAEQPHGGLAGARHLMGMPRPKSVVARPVSSVATEASRRVFSPQPSTQFTPDPQVLLQQFQQQRKQFFQPLLNEPSARNSPPPPGFGNVAAAPFKPAHHDVGFNQFHHFMGNVPRVRSVEPSTISREEGIAVNHSVLLEEFRASKHRRYELRDLTGAMLEFSVDQHGSRFIQQKLEVATPDEKQAVFVEILPHALQLMTDVFGNYVIQKFFEHGSTAQKVTLVTQMEGHVVALSLQMYGCRVVQKALEHIPMEQQALLVKELDGHVLKCVKDQNGNHVIQKCIERVPLPLIDFIIESFKNQIVSLASHPYGCRVIQRMFEHCLDEHSVLINELLQHTNELVQDQYGNYVIQHILERGKASEKKAIIAIVAEQVLMLSKHKFASNVVEKCVVYGSFDDRQLLMEKVCATGTDGVQPLMHMMKDQFANYVVQKMLDVMESTQRGELITMIRPHLSNLKRFTYGKHIISKIAKIDPEAVANI